MLEWFALIGAVGAATGGGATLWQRLLKPGLRSMLAAMELIEAQLRPNGGGSLVDRVDKLANSQTRIEHTLSCMHESIQRSSERLDRIEKRESEKV